MDFGGFEVAAEAAAATSYRTYSDVELLRKRRIEAEGAAAARKRLQCLRVGENESKKRARDHVSLRGWLTAARNRKCIGTSGDDGESFGGPTVDAQHLSVVSIDTVDGGGNDLQVISSSPATLVLSSSESPESLGGDDLEWTDREIPDVDDGHDFGGVDAGEAADLGLLHDASKKKRMRPARSYEMTRRFHTVWSAVWTWSEGVLADDGLLHQVRCLVCSGVGKKDFVMMPKRSTLEKHDQSSRHKQNLAIFAAKRPTSVLQQMAGCTTLEAKRKRVQLATLFQILCDGRPMLEFESRSELYHFLQVPHCPRAHWSYTSGWMLSEHMYTFVQKRMQELISEASYLAVTCDETTAVDNSSWLCLHVYVMENWSRKPLLLTLQKLDSDGYTSDSLLAVIIGILTHHGKIEANKIATKLICFGADGVSSFQGCKNGVSKQLLENWSPYVLHVHCYGHRFNLVVKTLSDLDIISDIEDLVKVVHAYFAHSPKKYSEFHSLALLMETKGLKLLKNVCTRWCSLIAPLRRVVAEYPSLLAKMFADREDKKWGRKASALLERLLDPSLLFGMAALLPLLEEISTLMQLAQSRNVYVCDFVEGVNQFQGSLYKLYLASDTKFRGAQFYLFSQLINFNHEAIHMCWSFDLNESDEVLAFQVGEHTISARCGNKPLSKDAFYGMVVDIKASVAEAAEHVIKEVRGRFPSHNIMDALGLVYPQYWLNGDPQALFRGHLDLVKKQYGEPKWIRKGTPEELYIPPILDAGKLEEQQHLFRVTMVHNAEFACNILPGQLENPLTKLWRSVACNRALVSNFPEFAKLAEIAIVQVLGSVEDERTFSSLSFLKDKTRNRLDNAHLSLVVGMHAQEVYTLKTFPYDACFQQWSAACETMRYACTS